MSTVPPEADLDALLRDAERLALDDPARGAEVARVAIARAVALRDDDRVADGRRHLADCLMRTRRLAEAAGAALQAIARYEAVGNLAGLAHATVVLSATHPTASTESVALLRRADALYEEIGDLFGRSVVASDQAIALSIAGLREEAIVGYRRAIAFADAAGRRADATFPMVNLARTALELARDLRADGESDSRRVDIYLDEAGALVAEALETASSLGRAHHVAICEALLAEVLVEQGQPEEAIAVGERALAAGRALDDETTERSALVAIGSARCRSGDAAGLGQIEAALALARASDAIELCEIHGALARELELLGDLAGALDHQRREGRARTDQTRRSLAAQLELHSQIEAQEQAAAAAAQLAALAYVDSLTGLANRRRLDEALVARRGGAALAIAIIDVDSFKAINDRFGHAVGDAVLVEVARTIRGACRADDVAARAGGDEFVLLLDGMPEHVAVARCASILERVARADWAATAPGLEVGLSAGVAHGGPDALAAADARLYEAKRAGRGRVAPELEDIGASPEPTRTQAARRRRSDSDTAGPAGG